MLPIDSSVEAEYTDGFILGETAQSDVSLYEDGRNTFYDILEKRPEDDHGKMVRFSVYWKNNRYDIDWTNMPDNARPIRFRDGYHSRNMSTGDTETGWSGVRFGFQFNDESGKNHQEIQELN